MTAEPMPVYNSTTVPTSDEKTWAMLAHLSALVNLFTGILGPVVAGVIYLAYKDRSRYIAYHALQSLVLQLIVWVGGGTIVAIAWTVTGLLTFVLVGLCLVPFAIALSLIPVIAPVYSIVGAIQTSQGADFKYWLIGDWTRGTLVD
jgi:uncharacterized Tic20 family protein